MKLTKTQVKYLALLEAIKAAEAGKAEAERVLSAARSELTKFEADHKGETVYKPHEISQGYATGRIVYYDHACDHSGSFTIRG